MALDIDTLLNKLVDHGLATGHFDAVNTHEPDNAPGNGITANIVLDTITPVAGGLATTSCRVAFVMALMYPTTVQPRDETEPYLIKALDAVMGRLTGDLRLDSTVRMIDLLGAHGDGLEAIAGYTKIQDQVYRVMELTIPLIVNDVWVQVD